MFFRLKKSVRRATIVIFTVGGGLFAIAAPVYAQDGSTSQTQGPAGIGILILLMGFAAIVLVGVAYVAQARGAQDAKAQHAKSNEEE